LTERDARHLNPTRRIDIASVDVIPVRLPLREPFVISYGTFPDVLSVLVRITDREGRTGWGEGTPDEYVTGESWLGVAEAIRNRLAPALPGTDVRNRELLLRTTEELVLDGPTARAAIDIAIHDLLGKVTGLPAWALLGGSGKAHLTVSRVVSMNEPEQMAADARRHVTDGFRTIKLKVGEKDRCLLDVERVATVRAAVGPDIGIKIDVNQGWQTADVAIEAIRRIAESNPTYIEQPVDWRDLDGLAEVRRTTGATIMVDEGCHGPKEMQRIVELRAADLVNIKLMKCGGLWTAVRLNGIAETAGIRAQVGTMVESSIASAAGLHLAMALANVRTVEMGGPLMLAEDIGDIRDWYARDTIRVPDRPGLGVEPDIERIRRFAEDWWTVSS
jgi:L-alanine-DL-glutamate epimerase-like enolase superfamily enzyme